MCLPGRDKEPFDIPSFFILVVLVVHFFARVVPAIGSLHVLY
jgi:hypothetical protein